MSAYKDLNIDRNKLEELIPTAIYTVFNKSYSYTLTNSGIAKMLIISAEVGEVKIAFYYNKKGGTTINPDIGNQTELSNKIAEILIDNSKISEKDNSICLLSTEFIKSDFKQALKAIPANIIVNIAKKIKDLSFGTKLIFIFFLFVF